MQSRGLVSALEAGSTSQYQYVTNHVDILSTYDALQGIELLLSGPSCYVIDMTRHSSLSLRTLFLVMVFALLANTRSNPTNPELTLVLNIHFLCYILACPRICSGKRTSLKMRLSHIFSLSLLLLTNLCHSSSWAEPTPAISAFFLPTFDSLLKPFLLYLFLSLQ